MYVPALKETFFGEFEPAAIPASRVPMGAVEYSYTESCESAPSISEVGRYTMVVAVGCPDEASARAVAWEAMGASYFRPGRGMKWFPVTITWLSGAGRRYATVAVLAVGQTEAVDAAARLAEARPVGKKGFGSVQALGRRHPAHSCLGGLK
jgi:hypothetical protein